MLWRANSHGKSINAKNTGKPRCEMGCDWRIARAKKQSGATSIIRESDGIMSDESLLKKIKFLPLTTERWNDFEKLFGKNGACGGCWCMFWRLPKAEYHAGSGDGNKQAMKSLVDTGGMPGIVAYDGERAVGWCTISPRAEYQRLLRARSLKLPYEETVWAVPCFFVLKEYRRKGVSVALLKNAVKYAKKQGATAVEGYPSDPAKNQPDAFVYTGLTSAFREAGFIEFKHPDAAKPVMRIEL